MIRRASGIRSVKILGNDDILKTLSVKRYRAMVTVGHNCLRARLFGFCRELGFSMINAIHPKAIVASDVVIGTGIAVIAGAVINSQSKLGDNVVVNTGATVDHDCVLGSHVHIAPGANLGGNVRVNEGAMIGMGAAVLPKLSIGAWSTVGAGAVVVRDVPPKTVVVGTPARVLRRID